MLLLLLLIEGEEATAWDDGLSKIKDLSVAAVPKPSSPETSPAALILFRLLSVLGLLWVVDDVAGTVAESSELGIEDSSSVLS